VPFANPAITPSIQAPAVQAVPVMPAATTVTAEPIVHQALKTVATMLTAGKATADDPSGMKSSPLAKSIGTVSVTHEEEWSGRSSEIVQGLLEAFLHKVSLHKGEKDCIEGRIGGIAASLVSAAEDSVSTIRKGLRPEDASMKVTEMVPFLLDGAGKVMGMVKLGERLMESCVLGDTVQLLNTTAKHLANATYLQKRLVVNGVDILESLTDSVLEWDRQEYRKFGWDIGTALRKILLSKANANEIQLPEGPAENEAIQDATDGFMRGFLNKGDEMIVTDAADPSVYIAVDLQKCLGDNRDFFRAVWTSAWTLVASMSANKEQYDLAKDFGAPDARGHSGEAIAEMTFTMMQIPLALQKCSVNQETEAMLVAAFHSINATRIRFNFGQTVDSNARAKEIKMKLARAVDDWKDLDFRGFGSELGTIMRDILLLAFPQKYHVDANGFIRRSLASPKVAIADGDSSSSSARIAFMAVLGALAAAVPVGMWRLRRRAYSQVPEQQQQEYDSEDEFLDLEEVYEA